MLRFVDSSRRLRNACSKLATVLPLLLLPGVASATEEEPPPNAGPFEIDQEFVDATGGFPLVIDKPGTYVLTSDLHRATPSAGDSSRPIVVSAVEIESDDVTLDLAGFSIRGDSICAIDPTGGCETSCFFGSPGAGISVRRGRNVLITNRGTPRRGAVRGFFNGITSRSLDVLKVERIDISDIVFAGVFAPKAHIFNVRVVRGGPRAQGIASGLSLFVSNSLVANFGGTGISGGIDSEVFLSAVDKTGRGIAIVTGQVSRSTVRTCQSPPIEGVRRRSVNGRTVGNVAEFDNKCSNERGLPTNCMNR